MSVAFSKDDRAVIEEKLSVGPVEPTPGDELDIKYHLPGCYKWISENSYKMVALQLPDELLVDAAPISLALQKATGCQAFILADTSYASCCVDEVAAEHVSADCVIHFGHACLSATSRLPVHYVFVDLPLDVTVAADSLCAGLPEGQAVVVFADVQYQHALDDLCRELSSHLPSVYAAEPIVPSSAGDRAAEPTDSSSAPAVTELLNRRVALPPAELDAATVLYVGSEGPTLTCLAMALGPSRLLAWDPARGGAPAEPGPAAARAVRRRYYMVERTKDATRVGIVVGTLAVRRYQEAIARLRRLLRAAGKRCYTLVCGKLNVAKLANFPELDVLVLVSCPESALVESADFLQPVVTPYEAELACNPDREWSGRYVAEFGRLLPGGDAHVPLPERAEPRTDVSLVTGRLRQLGREPEPEPERGGGLVPRPSLEMATHAGGAGEVLSERSWRGLEPRPGDTPVSSAVQGQRGIAAGYEQEGTVKETNDTREKST